MWNASSVTFEDAFDLGTDCKQQFVLELLSHKLQANRSTMPELGIIFTTLVLSVTH
jgi:hypothetical protein